MVALAKNFISIESAVVESGNSNWAEDFASHSLSFLPSWLGPVLVMSAVAAIFLAVVPLIPFFSMDWGTQSIELNGLGQSIESMDSNPLIEVTQLKPNPLNSMD